MPDPLEVLRTPIVPLKPPRAFSERLRRRLARALDSTGPDGTRATKRGSDDMTTTTTSESTPPAITRASIVPYLAVAGARQALEWYRAALGAQVIGNPIVMPDGRVGHAELDIAGARLMLSEEHPEIGVSAPLPGHGVPFSILLEVDNVDAVMERAVAQGASLERPAAEYEYGRNGVVRDPFGHRWLVSSYPPETPATGAPADTTEAQETAIRSGDIGYVSLWVPDAAGASAFFSRVLGWRYRDHGRGNATQVEGFRPQHGIQGGMRRSTLFCCFAVSDLDDALGRVRAAGGAPQEPATEAYGRVVMCSDDQGVSFALFQPPHRGSETPSTSGTNGDLAYVTMEVVDSSKAREFYSAVLGWTFTAGSVPDGWQVEGIRPMIGLSGGHDEATAIPMYDIEDISPAVTRVREAGGTATDPEVRPYGTTSSCSDDQGTRFYLRQP